MAKAQPTRQARERRRRAILQATLRVIASGVGAVSHRTVAVEANVPLASTTYYFESLDDLLEGALRLFVDDEAERLTALTARIEGKDLPRSRSPSCSGRSSRTAASPSSSSTSRLHAGRSSAR